jgi:hypothetical protein
MAIMPANRRGIHAAAKLYQGGVTPRSSGFRKFMQFPARQNYIGAGTQAVPAKGVKDQLGGVT